MNNKTIKGNLDNFGYIYIESSIVNIREKHQNRWYKNNN